MRRVILLVILLSVAFGECAVYASNKDSLFVATPRVSTPKLKKQRTQKPLNVKVDIRSPYKFRAEQLILPALTIGVGFVALESDWLKEQNRAVRNGLQQYSLPKYHFDDYIQYVPFAAPYALKLCGLRGLHGYAEYTILLATSYALMGITVNVIKTAVNELRPDGSAYNSFPSGHTATVFMGAELLRREYWSTQPWIGVLGYAVAFTTGFMRMYNNRHWLTDVVAGAGIGILCVEAAYWLYPVITKNLFPRLYNKNIFLTPTLSTNSVGVGCGMVF